MCLFCVPNNFLPTVFAFSFRLLLLLLFFRFIAHCHSGWKWFGVCVCVFALLIYGTMWYLCACRCCCRRDGGNGDDGFWVCHVYPRPLLLFFSLAYIVPMKKPHHSVDRLIFRSNSPFLFSFIFQRMHEYTRAARHNELIRSFLAFIALLSLYLFAWLETQTASLSLFSESRSAYRICFIIFLFSQTQLHKCNVNISLSFFCVERNKQPMKTYGWRLFLFHSIFLCAFHFVRWWWLSSST